MTTWSSFGRKLRQFVTIEEPLGKDLSMLDAILGEFFYFCLLCTAAIGSLTQLSPEQLSHFTAAGTVVTAACLSTLLLFPQNSGIRSRVLFLSSSALFFLPPVFLNSLGNSRLPLFELYYVLMLAIPALLQLWQWKAQMVAGFMAVLSAGLFWSSSQAATALQALVSVFLAAVLCVAVALLRSREAVQDALHLDEESEAILSGIKRQKLPLFSWSVLQLEGCLLITLLFLDFMVWRDLEIFPVMGKVYGVLVLVLGGLLIKVVSSETIERVLAVTTVLVGVSLSVARTGYYELQHFAMCFPIIYLAFLAAAFPWKTVNQVLIVWALLLTDTLIKIAAALWWNMPDKMDTGEVLLFYRGELFLLYLGGVLAVVLAFSIRRHRIRNLFGFQEFLDEPGEKSELAQIGRGENLASLAREALAPVFDQRLMIGLLLQGLAANLVISRLLLSKFNPSYEYAILGWVFLFASWAGLAYLSKKRVASDLFWLLGAVLQVVFHLGVCVVLLVVREPGYYWLYWIIGVFLGVAYIPWPGRLLAPLLVLTAFTGIELVVRLQLGLVGALSYAVSGVLAIGLFYYSTRALSQRCLLLSFPKALDGAGSEIEVLRILADHLSFVFRTKSCLYSLAVDHMELLRESRVFRMKENSWPLRELAEKVRSERAENGEVLVAPVNWLPLSWSFLDRRFGIFRAANGVLLQIPRSRRTNLQVSRPSDSGEQAVASSSEVVIFLPSKFPLSVLFIQSASQVAESLALTAAVSLDRVTQSELKKKLIQGFQDRLEEREQDLGALVHDINNTVQDLTLLCDSILEDVLSAPMGSSGSAYREVERQVKRISVIARSVATVVSDAKRRRELEQLSDLRPREFVEVGSVVSEVVSFAVLRAERKRILVEAPKQVEEKLWVRVSVREHLETILRNLLNNAITYSDPGTSVRIALRFDREWVWIDVIDNGSGLTREERDLLFVPGYRGRLSKGIPGGLGVGLAESKRVAEAAGGKLEVFSAGEGKGSTFTVALPRVDAPSRPQGNSSWALVVDDQPALAEFYSRLVRGLQFSAGAAGSVHEALDLVEKHGPPSLVVTDIHLGATNGLDLVRRLRAELGADLPILVISGISDASISERAREAGATDFVSKPIGRRALFARIESILPER